MQLFLVFLSLLGPKLLLQKFEKNFQYFSELIVICFFITLSFALGLFNFLKYAPWILTIIGITCFLIFLILEKFKFKLIKNKLFALDLVIFTFVFFHLFLKTRNYLINSWDEFTYWGLIDKEMYFHQSLPNLNFMTEFTSYPPGQGLFHFYFTKLLGFQESNLYFAQALLLILPLLGLFRFIFKKEFKYGLIFSFAIYLLIFIFSNGILTLMSDGICSIFFALLTIYLINFFTLNRSNLLTLLLLIFAFCLIKQICVVLALISIMTYFLVKIFTKHPFKKTSIASLLLIVFVFTAKLSWEFYLQRKNIPLYFSGNYSIIKLVNDNIEKNQHISTVTKNFLKSFTNKEVIWSPLLNLKKVSIIIIISILICFILIHYLKRKTPYILHLHASLFLGFLGYCLVHLLIYAYGMGIYSGVTTASFSRYMNIYLLSWFIIFYFYVFETDEIKQNYFIVFFTCLLISISQIGAFSFPKITMKSMQYSKERVAVKNTLSSLEPYIQNYSKIVYGFQESRGLEKHILLYEKYPIKPYAAYSFGKPYYPEDVWTQNFSEIEFKDFIKNADYFYIYNPDQNFCTSYPNIFKQNCLNHHLYKIVIENQTINLKIIN